MNINEWELGILKQREAYLRRIASLRAGRGKSAAASAAQIIAACQSAGLDSDMTLEVLKGAFTPGLASQAARYHLPLEEDATKAHYISGGEYTGGGYVRHAPCDVEDVRRGILPGHPMMRRGDNNPYRSR